HYCSNGTCVKACDFFSKTPGCASDQRCRPEGVCEAGSTDVDPAALGAACAATTQEGTLCGDDSGALRGVCADIGNGITCLPFCRTSTKDCGGGSVTCFDAFTNFPEVGFCADLGACGDGGTDSADCKTCLNTEFSGCCSGPASDCQNDTSCNTL